MREAAHRAFFIEGLDLGDEEVLRQVRRRRASTLTRRSRLPGPGPDLGPTRGAGRSLPYRGARRTDYLHPRTSAVLWRYGAGKDPHDADWPEGGRRLKLRRERVEGKGFSSIAYRFLSVVLKSGAIITVVALRPPILRHSHSGRASSMSPYSPFSNTLSDQPPPWRQDICVPALKPAPAKKAGRMSSRAWEGI
jgi:hypothetical protein